MSKAKYRRGRRKAERLHLDMETRSSMPLTGGYAEELCAIYYMEGDTIKKIGFKDRHEARMMNPQLALYAMGVESLKRGLAPTLLTPDQEANTKLYGVQDRMTAELRSATERLIYNGDTHIGDTEAMRRGTEMHKQIETMMSFNQRSVIAGGDLLHGGTFSNAKDGEKLLSLAELKQIEKMLLEHMIEYALDAFTGALVPCVNRPDKKPLDNEAEPVKSGTIKPIGNS